MPCCLGQYEHTVGATVSYQAEQPLLQHHSYHGVHQFFLQRLSDA